MVERLSAVLQRFERHACVFHGGSLCGVTDFDGQHGAGQLHLLRHGSLGVTVIEQRLVDGGLMAGLADPRLHRALAAVHAEPARAWTL